MESIGGKPDATMSNSVQSIDHGLTAGVNSNGSAASRTAGPMRHMTDQHRKSLSASMKKAWALRGGLSSEHRRRISDSLKQQWASRGPMPEEHRRKIAVANRIARARKKAHESVVLKPPLTVSGR